MTVPSAPTKADLLEMLSQAVRNTQPQSVSTQPERVGAVQPEPKRKTPPRNKRPASKRTAKIKSVRASARRERQP
jgi:hypothetical protein